MKTRIVLLALLVSLFISCKDEKSVDSLEVVTSEAVNKNFQVVLDVLVTKNDDFALFYTQDGTTNFKGDPIWIGVKGSESPQKIVFNLPEDTIPTNIRLDFGISDKQEPMKINSYEMSYAGKKFTATGIDFFKYFAPNVECTNVDKEKSLIIPLKKEGKYFGPSFYPEIALSDEIAKIVK